MKIVIFFIKAFYYFFIEIYRIKSSLTKIVVVEAYYKACRCYSNIIFIEVFSKPYSQFYYKYILSKLTIIILMTLKT